MNNPHVSKISKEELASVRPTVVQPKPSTTDVSVGEKRGDYYSTEFIKQLKLSEIQKFFEKFDVTACAKMPNQEDPKFVFVSCRCFNVVFSDYSFVFDFNGGMIEPGDDSKPKFDLSAFAKYCESIDQAPDQVIGEIMAVELFGQRFSSYAPRRREVKQKENKLAFNALPREMQKTLKTFHEKQEQSIDATYNKNYFGSYDISSTLSTSDKQ